MTDKWNPTVAVLGAGAMGSVFGGLLCEGGLDVILVDVWQEHVEKINQNGLRIVGHGGDRTVPIKAFNRVGSSKPVDVVLVQCKAKATKQAILAAKGLFGDNSVAISFQNGLGNEEIIAEILGSERVLGGSTSQGASVEEAGVVRNFSDLASHIGEMMGGPSERASSIAKVFTEAGLRTYPSESIQHIIWKKLFANVALGPACAVADLTIYGMKAIPELWETALSALDEALAVSNAEGFDFTPEQAREALFQIVGEDGTGDNKPSICADINKKRPTEIDVMNGAIVRLGRRHGIPTPVNRTLVAVVKGMESNYI